MDAVSGIPNPEAAEPAMRNLVKRFCLDAAQFQDDSPALSHPRVNPIY
jgi:hypothetical protein